MVPTKEKDINAVTGKNKIWNSCALTDKYIEIYFCYQKLFMFSFVAFIPMLEIKYIVKCRSKAMWFNSKQSKTMLLPTCNREKEQIPNIQLTRERSVTY